MGLCARYHDFRLRILVFNAGISNIDSTRTMPMIGFKYCTKSKKLHFESRESLDVIIGSAIEKDDSLYIVATMVESSSIGAVVRVSKGHCVDESDGTYNIPGDLLNKLDADLKLRELNYSPFSRNLLSAIKLKLL